MDALITAHAAAFPPTRLSRAQSQRPGRTAGDALAAMIADPPGFGLWQYAQCSGQPWKKKNCAAVAGTVDIEKGMIRLISAFIVPLFPPGGRARCLYHGRPDRKR